MTKTTLPSSSLVVGALGAVSRVATFIYEKITGPAYSKQELQKMSMLKNIYQQSFGIDPPFYWELDEKNRPTHRVKNKNWLQYVRQLKRSKGPAGHYHYQSDLITEYAMTYLLERSQRFLANGKSGDLIEQFFGEWIQFAINDLPALSFDATAIQTLKARYAYLTQIQKQEGLFHHGRLKRDKNKSDAIQSIKLQIEAALFIAEKEFARRGAREVFDALQGKCSLLLNALSKTFYYARGKHVAHEPLEIDAYLDPERSFLSTVAKKLYPEIKKTHTGGMLRELLQRAGENVFGMPQKSVLLLDYIYFSKDGRAKDFTLESAASDLPPWVPSSKTKDYLSALQTLGEHLLRLSNVKTMIELAYELAGKAGDLWIYGDRRGLASLQALLFLAREETNTLDRVYTAFYKSQSDAREAYNLSHRVNPDQGANPNFNCLDDIHHTFYAVMQDVNNLLQEIETQVKNFPLDSRQQFYNKQTTFCRLISQYLNRFYPEAASRYPDLSDESDITETMSHATDHEIAHYRSTIQHTLQINSVYPWKRTVFAFESKCYGKSYYVWIALYRQIEGEMLSIFDHVSPPVQIHRETVSYLYQASIQLKTKINQEKPCWRFSSWGYPLSVGWPFRRQALLLSNVLSTDIDRLSGHIRKILDEAATVSGDTEREAVVTADQALLPIEQSDKTCHAHALKEVRGIVERAPLRVLPAAAGLVARSSKHKLEAPRVEEKACVLPLEGEPTVHENIVQSRINVTRIDEWFTTISQALSDYTEQDRCFRPFKTAISFQAFLDALMHYIDSLPDEVRDITLETWDGLFDVLILEAECADVESKKQLSLAALLKDLLRTEPDSAARQAFVQEAISKLEPDPSAFTVLSNQSMFRRQKASSPHRSAVPDERVNGSSL